MKSAHHGCGISRCVSSPRWRLRFNYPHKTTPITKPPSSRSMLRARAQTEPPAIRKTLATKINPAGAAIQVDLPVTPEFDVRRGFLRSRDGSFTIFDAPGASTSPFEGTRAYGLNPAGTIAGYYDDASSALTPSCAIPTEASPRSTLRGALKAAGRTFPFGNGSIINPAGAITGYYIDSSSGGHGFVRAPGGTITGFDPTGSLYTEPEAINPAGTITGFYCDATNCHGFVRAPGGTMTSFDVPGDLNGTQPNDIDPEGAITGYYGDAGNVYHGFLRARDGTITTFDVQGVGAGSGQGTFPETINPAGTITGVYTDTSYVNHGFLRARDGTITTFDAPGAGASSGQGTLPFGINPSGATDGYDIDGSGVYHGFLRQP